MKTRLGTRPGLLATIGVLLAAINAARAEEDMAARHPPVSRLERVPALEPEQSRQAIQALPGFRDRGRRDRLVSAPPPSEPCRRFSRTRLSSQWFYLKED